MYGRHWQGRGRLLAGQPVYTCPLTSSAAAHIYRPGMTAKAGRMQMGCGLGRGLVLSIAIMNTAILLMRGQRHPCPYQPLPGKGNLLQRCRVHRTGPGYLFLLFTMMGRSATGFLLPSRKTRDGCCDSCIYLCPWHAPFSKLVNLFYPLVGYLGLVFIACVIYRGIKGLFVL